VQLPRLATDVITTLVLVLSLAPACALADPGDVGGDEGLTTLAPVEVTPSYSSIDAATAPSTAPTAPVQSPTASPTIDPSTLDGTSAQLQVRRAALVTRRNAAQVELLELELDRTRAEDALDLTLERYQMRLADLLDGADGGQRLRALMAAHKQQDPAQRDLDIAQLPEPDRILLTQEAAARARVQVAAAAADAQRDLVLQLGTSVDAIQSVLDGRVALDDSGHHGAPVDANLIFASGPIPGIGYWGAVNGDNGMLGGWPSFAAAAMGGVGCTPPSADLRATGRIEQGEASWYGPDFNGKGTASGETYDQEALTAAHPTLPFGTIVRVSSSETAQCVFLRINDRGPYAAGRIIDLSHAGAVAIGMNGTAPVQVEVWAPPA
jgi:rare lipoprotein A